MEDPKVKTRGFDRRKSIQSAKEKCGSVLKAFTAAALLYLVIALAIFYPITLNMFASAPGSGASPFQNLWNIWWVNYALLNLHASIYSTSLLFWPVGANLTFQAMAPLTALLSAPFQLAGVAFSYNLMFMLGFAFSGAAMFLLARYLVKNGYAAFIAGLVFTFSAFHIAQSYANLGFVFIGWVPLFLYFTLRILREKRNYWSILGMSLSFAFATLMGNAEQSLMLLMLLALIVLMYAINKRTRSRVFNRDFAVSMALFAAAALLIGSWSFVPMLGALLKPGGLSAVNLANTAKYSETWSSDLLSFFVPSYYNGIFSFMNASSIYGSLYSGYELGERTAYVGFTAIALSLYGMFQNRKRSLPWLALAVVFGWLAIGPYLQIAGTMTQIPGLYQLYHLIPALNSISEPGRFNLILTMMVAILSAFGAKALIEKFGEAGTKKKALYLAVALSLLILVESNGMPLGSSAIAGKVSTSVIPSNVYTELSNLPGNFSVILLPALDTQTSAMATYYTSIMHKPIVGGYVSRPNLTEELSIYNIPLAIQSSTLASEGAATFESPVNENFTNQTLLSLYNYNTSFVLVQKNAYKNSTSLLELLNYLVKTFGNPVYNDNTTTAFTTANSVDRSLFRSYVSYPIVTEWQEVPVPFNGTITRMWLPSSPGAMAVYAPYLTSPLIQQSVNTTLTFEALAPKPSVLLIEEQSSSGIARIAAVNVSGSLRPYRVNATLVSGPRGNLLFFMEDQDYPIYVSNITYSKG